MFPPSSPDSALLQTLLALLVCTLSAPDTSHPWSRQQEVVGGGSAYWFPFPPSWSPTLTCAPAWVSRGHVPFRTFLLCSFQCVFKCTYRFPLVFPFVPPPTLPPTCLGQSIVTPFLWHSGSAPLVAELSGTSWEWHRSVHSLLPHRSPLQLSSQFCPVQGSK